MFVTRRSAGLLLLFSYLGLSAFQSSIAQSTTLDAEKTFSTSSIEKRLEGDFGADDIVATTGWVQTTGIADWLGPLAPVAISPFFGVACLSGLAIWGPDWVTDNALLGSSGPLKNETLFVVFVALTLLTSLPRLTKVSKPFAQAVDRLETYAVIAILLIIKVVASLQTEPGQQVAMVQLGIFSVTADTLVGLAMAANVLVINSVKFFFEFMVWLTPIPLVDAIFEVCSKTLCAALMVVYAFSPMLATGINLVILIVATVVLRWISRRVRFYRTMILDPVLAKMWRGFGRAKTPDLIVFPKDNFGPFAAKSRLRLSRSPEAAGWTLQEANWWMPAKSHNLLMKSKPTARSGWVMNSIELQDTSGPVRLTFSRRYDPETLQALLNTLEIEYQTHNEKMSSQFAKEFA